MLNWIAAKVGDTALRLVPKVAHSAWVRLLERKHRREIENWLSDVTGMGREVLKELSGHQVSSATYGAERRQIADNFVQRGLARLILKPKGKYYTATAKGKAFARSLFREA